MRRVEAGVAAAIVALVTSLAVAGAADRPISRGALLTRLGSDTLTVESYERHADRMRGRVARRVPRAGIVEYEVTLGKGGRPERATFRILAPAGTTTPPPRVIEATFRPDSAFTREQRDTLVRRAWALPDAFIGMPDSYGTAELWLSWLRTLGTDTATVVQVAPIGGPSGRSRARIGSRDSIYLQLPTGWFRIRADRRGHLLSLDGSDSPVKHIVTPLEHADVDAYAARFATLEREGHGLGSVVSPRDTARATIGGATLWVDYGRPSRRGRRVYDHGILGDTLWRTGANAATQLFSSRDLSIEGVTLAAGKYSLWTRVKGDGYALVINTQSGQWGTQHDPARDLRQFALEKRALDPAVETFKIRIEPSGGSGGTLRLQWDDAELTLPFEVKP